MTGFVKRLWHRLTFHVFNSASSDIDPSPATSRDTSSSPATLGSLVLVDDKPEPKSSDTVPSLNDKDIEFLVPKISRKMVVTRGKCTSKFCTCPMGFFHVPDSQTGLRFDALCVENNSRGGCGHTLAEHGEFSSSFQELESQSLSRVPRLRDLNNPRKLVDPKLCPRINTVKQLWERLGYFRVAHCRATPTSGKTQLARLLENYVATIPNMEVVYLSWPSNGQDLRHKSYDFLLKEFGNMQWDGLLFDYSNLLIICDEAQNSYQFDSFWNDLIKVQSQGVQTGPYIALFSSWGSPSATAVTYDGSAPAYLRPDQRVSIGTLYFTREEFEDVIDRVCSADSLPLLPDLGLVDYLFYITSGHPGCIRAILEVLIHSDDLRPYRQEGRTVDCGAARHVIDNPTFFSTLKCQAGFGRSLPLQTDLQNSEDVIPVLRQAVLRHRLLGPLQGNTGLETAYKRGWLHAELPPETEVENPEPQYIFPTEVHRWYCLNLLIPVNHQFPTAQFNNLVENFCFEAIKKFSASCFLNATFNLSSGGTKRPLEAVYQDELYRCCYEIMNKSYLTSEWSFNSKGRIDFYVGGGARWGIECVRDGDRLDDHISRFKKPDGIYSQWPLAQYIILDFRTTKPTELRNYPHLFYVVFTNNFMSCEILNFHGRKVETFAILQ